MRSETCRCAFASSAPRDRGDDARGVKDEARQREPFPHGYASTCGYPLQPRQQRLLELSDSGTKAWPKTPSPTKCGMEAAVELAKTPRQLQRSSERERMAETRGGSARLGGRDDCRSAEGVTTLEIPLSWYSQDPTAGCFPGASQAAQDLDAHHRQDTPPRRRPPRSPRPQVRPGCWIGRGEREYGVVWRGCPGHDLMQPCLPSGKGE